jgi:Ion channel
MANPILKFRNLQLLIVLLGFFLVIPFFGQDYRSGLFLSIYISLIMIFAVLATGTSRKVSINAICFGAFALIMGWVNISLPPTTLTLVLSRISFGMFFAYIAVILLMKIFRTRKVSANTVLGAACVYILVGIVWAFVYLLVEDIAPGSFSVPEVKDAVTSNYSMNSLRVLDFIYLSFVTISTLGYGDILPLSRMAKMLCIQETIFGQLYIACLVARLVGLYTAQQNQEIMTEEMKDDD